MHCLADVEPWPALRRGCILLTGYVVQAAEKAKAAAAVVKSEVKKSAGKVAKKAPKAKKALKRMVSEIDAEDASE